ncbi:MAG: PQQ-dependent sugar dehydrogenase, partial [Bacteroidota bacterium]
SSIPQDNPIGGSAVWSWGHRNAQGLLIAPNGRMYISEHGPSTDDEINIIEPGRNYGWPVVKGFCDLASETFFCNDSNVVEPVTAWTPTIATSDIAWYDHDAIPEFQDRLLLTSLKDQTLYAIALNGDGTTAVDEATYLTGMWGRLRDVVVAPDGSVYLATNGFSFGNPNPFTHRIVRLWNPLATSIDETPESAQLSLVIAPNPVAGAFEVQFPESLVGGTFEVVDVLGKVIHSGAVKATQMMMDSAEWPRGTYLLNSRHGAAQVAQRFIVQ